jgi:hypothetical protein
MTTTVLRQKAYFHLSPMDVQYRSAEIQNFAGWWDINRQTGRLGHGSREVDE